MKDALWPLSMNVVRANAASPSGAGSAAGMASISVGAARRSSAMVAMAEPSWSVRPGLALLAGSREPVERQRGQDLTPWFFTLRQNPKRNPKEAALGCEVVREVGQQLAAVVRHEHEILEPAAAPAGAVEARLDRDDVARDQLARRTAEPRLLVHLEPDAVAERVEEAVLEDFPRLLRELRRIAVLAEEV